VSDRAWTQATAHSAANDALSLWLAASGWSPEAARAAAEQTLANLRDLSPRDFGFES
jgi:hypothetical protein